MTKLHLKPKFLQKNKRVKLKLVKFSHNRKLKSNIKYTSYVKSSNFFFFKKISFFRNLNQLHTNEYLKTFLIHFSSLPTVTNHFFTDNKQIVINSSNLQEFYKLNNIFIKPFNSEFVKLKPQNQPLYPDNINTPGSTAIPLEILNNDKLFKTYQSVLTYLYNLNTFKYKIRAKVSLTKVDQQSFLRNNSFFSDMNSGGFFKFS